MNRYAITSRHALDVTTTIVAESEDAALDEWARTVPFHRGGLTARSFHDYAHTYRYATDPYDYVVEYARNRLHVECTPIEPSCAVPRYATYEIVNGERCAFPFPIRVF